MNARGDLLAAPLFLAVVTAAVEAASFTRAASEERPAAAAADSVWVFRDVHVLPMTTDSPVVLARHAVVVRGHAIAWLGPDAEVRVPAGAREIQAAGRYLMPGLIDMHAHVAGSYLPLFIANGVTTVREMNGSPRRLELRERVRQGQLAGPRLIVGSPLLTARAWPVGHLILPDADSANAAAPTLAHAGYDFLKIYDGLSVPTYDALITFARHRRMRVTGHIPSAVGLDGVLAAGQDIEHVEKIVWATVGHEPDTAAIPDIVRRIRAAGVSVTPTLHAQKVLNSQGSREFDALFDRAENALVDSATLAWWMSLRRPGVVRSQDPQSRGARLYAFQEALVRQLFTAGVPLLFGTDTPNPLLVPGFSMHDEVGAWTAAGIPTHAVLRSATAISGAWLGISGLGTIAAGAPADLLLLRDNPLTSPRALRSPDLVLAGGRLYDRKQLERLTRGIHVP